MRSCNRSPRCPQTRTLSAPSQRPRAPSELLLSGYTRRSLDEPVLARTITRSVWVASTLEGWRWLLEHLSQRMSDQVTTFAEDSGAEVNPMGAVMGQIAPLLLGIQAGTLVGHLAQESLGRYDPLISRNDDGRLFFVVSNVEKLSDEYSLDPEGLRKWLALQDVARHLVLTGVDWVNKYFRSLFFELLDSIEIDASELQTRLAELQTQSPEALEEGLGIDQVIPIVPTVRHAQALDRLRAFVACVEGYAKHSSTVVAGEVVGDFEKIEEGVTRHTNASSPGKAMLSQILGVTFDRALEASGATFCAAVAKLHGIQALESGVGSSRQSASVRRDQGSVRVDREGHRGMSATVEKEIVFGDRFVNVSFPADTHFVSPGFSLPLEPTPDLTADDRRSTH